MDGTRFDRWARLVAVATSRRTLVRGLGAATVATTLGVPAAEAAKTCTRNGKGCGPKKRGQCCSGKCRKSRRRHGSDHRCKPAPNAQGCTTRDDSNSCVLGSEPVPCPGNPDGLCVVLDNGKPFCAGFARCSSCDTGADCDEAFGLQGGICVKRCPDCAGQGNNACVFGFGSL